MHVAASTGRMVAGRYLLQNTIGRGAMGTVWRARDTVLARDVAVKEVRLRGPVTAGSVMTEETRVLYQRTLREARTAARLNHPAVVTVFDVVEADGSPWIVMELVQARSLDQVLTEDGPLRPQQAAELGRRVLGALACAHTAGILHRDVKPSNVLLQPDGRTVLTDFGIATLEGDSGLTQAGMVMGTPGFTAPERIRGDAASPASDLWSLGATLYAAVEGRGPFDDRGNSIAILAAIANEEAPRPRSAGPLRPVIEALLHRNPQARPDAAAVSRLLAAAGTAAATGGNAAGTRAGIGAAGSSDAGSEPAGSEAAAGTGTSSDPGRQAGEALLTAPLGLAMPGPQARVPASGISQPGAPRPDGPWEGPDDPWPEGPLSETPWPKTPWPEKPRSSPPANGSPGSGHPWSGGPPEPGDAAWAGRVPAPGGPAAARAPASGPAPGRHGAPAPGLRHGLAADLAAMLPRGRRRLLVFLGALAIVGAGIAAGMALTHGTSSSGAPTGAQATTAGQAGAPPAFTMTVPAGWQTTRQGPGTRFSSPAGDVSILVMHSAAGAAQMRRWLLQSLTQGRLPGHQPISRRPFSFSGGPGMAWQFTWQPASGGWLEVRNIAFRLASPGGGQAYLMRESAPVPEWAASQPEFRQALSTFRARS